MTAAHHFPVVDVSMRRMSGLVRKLPTAIRQLAVEQSGMYERFNVLYGCRQDAERDIKPTRVCSIRVLGGLRYALCSEPIAQTATC